jgi:hypothetical protein
VRLSRLSRLTGRLEDVIEFVVLEKLADAHPGWEQVVRIGRRRFADAQLRAAVRHDPSAAAEVLTKAGWKVKPPD